MNQIMFDTVEKRLIREGINISIFPEGTCTSRAEVQELKTGTARMAIEVAMKTHGKVRFRSYRSDCLTQKLRERVFVPLYL